MASTTAEDMLRELSTTPAEPPRINLTTDRANKAFERNLAEARAIARDLLGASISPSFLNMVKYDVGALLDFIRLAPGETREARDGGTQALRLVESAKNAMLHVASAHGLVLAGSGADVKLVGTVRPSEAGAQSRLEKLEHKMETIERAISPEIAERVATLASEMQRDRETMSRLLAEVGKDATTLKVGDYHTFFAKTAKKHRTSARNWLITTTVLTILTLAAAAGSVYHSLYIDVPPGREIEAAIAKAVVILVVLSATVWGGLNYRTHQHNAVVNEHRGDALGSFDAFWNAANTKEAKDAVLVQASNAIYLPQSSGFAGKDGDANATSLGLLAGLLSRRE